MWKKWKFWKNLKILKVRSDCDFALKILLETGLNLKFHANLKKYEKLQDVSMKHFLWKMKKWKKSKSFRLWFYAENLARNWSKFEISCKFEKIWKTSWCVNETFFCEIMKNLKKFSPFQNRFDCDSTLKTLLETGLNLKFHENLKQYEKLHDVSICTSWNICVSWTKRAWELYESSRRKPGWRFTAGGKSARVVLLGPSCDFKVVYFLRFSCDFWEISSKVFAQTGCFLYHKIWRIRKS